MSVTTSDPDEALARLRRAQRVLITSHSSPEGDALGSELALVELAERLGLESMVVNRDPAPSHLGALPGVERIVVGSTLPADFPDSYDLVAVVECPELERPGFDGLDRLPILNIDHHRANTCYGEVNYLEEDAPAVGEMVWQMYRAAGVAPSSAAATNMYLALSTDTGDFRYPNTTARAFRAAAELAEAGAVPAQVAEWVHEQRSPASVRLLGEALRSLRIDSDGQLATIAVDPDGFRRAGAGPEDTEDLVAVPRSIAGVRVVAFFKQWQPGLVRVSLRSKGTVDVRQVAARFGGGGHTNAAGCSLQGDVETARRRMTALLAELLDGCE